ncbi:hypothetical protein LO762_24860 [Actinocorallia sp. API 0066]|uniref:effector-associated domain 2-containing protein n=1 Tax=Actinocorallia sp. API 0066 TaxID=2896846 RepID=UPI001E343EAC|nr:hypothetical protein [Actinocorallia sp. API 0066]MCD0452395.1 hypothetical protein [Actinocorallia sp. API 0066]
MAENRWAPSGACLLFACDVVSYGDARRTDDVQEYVRAGLYRALEASFGHAGIPYQGVYMEDRGDGTIAAVPPEYDPALLVTAFFDRLRAELKRYNRLASEVAQIRLRMSVHPGVAKFDGRGLVGTDANHLCRLLDALSFKTAMADTGATLGLIVSERFHTDVVRRDSGVIDPDEYRPLRVAVKETDCVGWVRLPPPPAPVVPLDAGGEEVARRDERAPASGPPWRDHEPRVAPSMAWTVVVQRAMEVPAMLVERTREAVVQALGPQIASVIPRSNDARTDVIAIVRTCLDHGDGMVRFFDAVRFVAGETASVQRLGETIAEYWDEL